MDALPEIDDHVRLVAAAPDRTWRALLAVLAGAGRELPGPLVAAWGLDPPSRRGDWDDPSLGSTLPGFVAAEVDPARLLTLRGRHRFSRYEIRFTLDPDAGGVALHVRTAAVFPGVAGHVYRALVIGSGGHAVIMRLVLARVGRLAERTAPGGGA